ncbi:MAG: pyrimidine dimer DNA glycosylase/endonuclease V [Patescibacteria group bacterium]
MRLWSISPEYLDRQGLVALWRETLLARKVLEGKTKGYKNHPQLERFKESRDPLASINYYLSGVYQEAQKRRYHFDAKKISVLKNNVKDIKVNNGQVNYEFNHLLRKLETRDFGQYSKIKDENRKMIRTNKLFKSVDGDIERWEKIK